MRLSKEVRNSRPLEGLNREYIVIIKQRLDSITLTAIGLVCDLKDGVLDCSDVSVAEFAVGCGLVAISR